MNLENLPCYRATIEVMGTASFREQVKSANLIMTLPTSPEWNPQIAFGTETLQSIASNGRATVLNTLRLVIDWTTEEPEYLTELLHQIKGKCDFQ